VILPMTLEQLVYERLTGDRPEHTHLFTKCYKCGEVFCPRCCLSGLTFVLEGGYRCPECDVWLGSLPSYWTQHHNVESPLLWHPSRRS
jgi:hypothetical protein